MLRRSLLRGILALLGAGSAPTAASAAGPAAASGDAPGARPPGSPERSDGLSPAEVDDLIAYAEIVVEGGPLTPEGRRSLVEHVQDRAAQSERSRAEYRTAVELLARLGGAPFSSLDPARRLDLLTRHRLVVPEVEPDERLGAHAREIRIVRGRVVPDLIAGYYNSPAGWAIVGYTAFPGRCGDLERYTRPEP